MGPARPTFVRFYGNWPMSAPASCQIIVLQPASGALSPGGAFACHCSRTLPRGAAAHGDQQCLTPLAARSPMAVLPLTASPGALSRRLRLSPGPAAVGQAPARGGGRSRLAAAGQRGLAVLLTWDLVTSVTTEGPGGGKGTEGPAGPEVTPAASGTAVGGTAASGTTAGGCASSISCGYVS